jgi:hypothetical protein
LREVLVRARREKIVLEPLIWDSPATPENLRLVFSDRILKKRTADQNERQTDSWVTVAWACFESSRRYRRICDKFSNQERICDASQAVVRPFP